MGGFLFMLRASPDVDHLAPLAWKVLERGEPAVVVFERPYPVGEDYRLRFLATFPGFRLLEAPGIASHDYPTVLAARLRWRGRRLRRLLETWQIGAVIMDWGHGATPWSRLNAPLPRLWDGRFWWRALRGPMARLRVVGDYLVPPFRVALISAAREAGLPVFCLPHGVQLRTTPKAAPPGRGPHGRQYDDGRRAFAACVFPSELERQHQIERFGLDPARAHVWGSLRFTPEWSGILREICPPAQLPPCRDGQVRAVFFLPKWIRQVDAEGTFALLRALAARSDVQVVVRGHARPGRADLSMAASGELHPWPGVILSHDHAPALIRTADVVIVVNSSIALEALLQGKPLIYAAYLHGHRLVFDELGGCLRARAATEVHRFLDAIAAGRPPTLDPLAVDRILRTVVYGGREPFDVLTYYHTEIRRRMSTATRDASGPAPAAAPPAA